MASSKSAAKRIRQNAKHRARNRWRLRSMRHAIKELDEQILHGSTEQANEAFKNCARIIDISAAKGVIHKNQAARRKSRLSAKLKNRKS